MIPYSILDGYIYLTPLEEAKFLFISEIGYQMFDHRNQIVYGNSKRLYTNTNIKRYIEIEKIIKRDIATAFKILTIVEDNKYKKYITIKPEHLFYTVVRLMYESTVTKIEPIFKDDDEDNYGEQHNEQYKEYIMYVDNYDYNTYLIDIETKKKGIIYPELELAENIEIDNIYYIHNPLKYGIQRNIIKDTFNDIEVIFDT